jgi:hypothetical protein
MTIKHSKYRNTGILFELLVRQTTSDLLENKDSKAVKLLKKYFNNTDLGREYSLYTSFNIKDKLSESKIEMLISTIIDERKKLNQEVLNKLKYNLIKEIKSNYNIDNFFKAKINNYKTYASIYNIFESIYSKSINTNFILKNKLTLLECVCANNDNNKKSDSIIDDFVKEDKEIRILAYKIMVEKFNDRYKNLSDRQKNVLKEYINNISETENLKEYINKTINSIKTELGFLKESIEDQVTKIKLTETIKLIKPINKNQFVKDETIESVLQYIDLIEQIKLIK